jgi:hypothetical protein
MQGNPRKTVDNILAALKKLPSDFTLGRIAEDYAAMCTETVFRLDQCQTLLDSHDEFNAWNVINTPPDLLGLLEILDMPQAQADEWRKICVAHSLTIPPGFNPSAIEKVKALFSNAYIKGMTEHHPLYAEYRKAIRLRNEEAAFRALQVIVRVNPTDKHAAADYARHEQAQQRAIITKLENALAKKDTREILALLETIEQIKWDKALESPALVQAQTIREEKWIAERQKNARVLLAEAEKLLTTHSEEWAENVYSEIEEIGKQLQIDWTPRELNRMELLATGLAQARELREIQKEQRRTLESFDTELTQKEKLLAGPSQKIPALENGKFAINNYRKRLESLGIPIPEKLTRRAAEFLRKIEIQIRKKRRNRRIKVLSTIALIFITASAGTWLWQDFNEIETLAARLEEASKTGSVAQMQKLVTIAEEHSRRIASPRLTPELAKAKNWLANQEKIHVQYLQKKQQAEFFVKNIDNKTQGIDITKTAAVVDELERNFSQLAPNYKKEFEAALLYLRADWNAKRKRWTSFRQDAFTAALTTQEERIKAMDKVPKIADRILAIQEISDAQENLQIQADRLEKQNLLLSENKVRHDSLKNTVTLWKAVAEQWTKSETALKTVSTLEEYQNILKSISELSVTSDPYVNAATAALRFSSEFSNENLLGQNLFPNDPGACSAMKQPDALLPFLPDSFPASITETTTFEAIQEVMPKSATTGKREVYAVELKQYVEKTREQFEGEWAASTRGSVPPQHNTKIVYSSQKPEIEPSVKSNRPIKYCKIQTRDKTEEYVVFNSISVAPAPESLFFKQYFGDNSTNAATAVMLRSPIQILDEVLSNDKLSPLFQAYVIQELIKTIKIRPYKWGVHVLPEYQRFTVEFNKIFQNPIEKDEWLAGKEGEDRKRPLLTAFAKIRKATNFSKQAAQQHMLLLKALQGKFILVGYLGLDKTAVFIDNKKYSGRLWCFSKDGKLLRGPMTTNWKLADSLPFSPLVRFESDGKSEIEIISEARQKGDTKYIPDTAMFPLYSERKSPKKTK